MKLSPVKGILEIAEERSIIYSVYMTVSHETALVAIEAGAELGTPVIFITGTDHCDPISGFEKAVGMAKRTMKIVDCEAPVAFHLDHCHTYKGYVQAAQAGYSSIMIDGSSFPLEENVALTRKVANYIHCYGVTIERELGKPVGEKGSFRVEGDSESAQIGPDQVREFVEHTSIDYVAISIRTQHGVYVATPRLNIEQLKKIHNAMDVPIVLRGGSGISKEQVQEVIRNEVREINITADVLIMVTSFFESMKQKPDSKYSIGMFVNSQACAGKFTKGKVREFALMG